MPPFKRLKSVCVLLPHGRKERLYEKRKSIITTLELFSGKLNPRNATTKYKKNKKRSLFLESLPTYRNEKEDPPSSAGGFRNNWTSTTPLFVNFPIRGEWSRTPTISASSYDYAYTRRRGTNVCISVQRNYTVLVILERFSIV